MIEKLSGASKIMDCEDARAAISAAIDGELAPVERLALNAHIRACRQCDAYIKGAFTLQVRLRGELKDERDPDALWTNVLRAIDDGGSTGTPISAASRPRALMSRRTALVSGLAAALVMAIGAVLVREKGDHGQPPVVSETVNDFLTFRASGRRLDVANRGPQDIKDWFATRVDFELPFDPTPPAEFRLAGGRLCSFLNRRLATLHYERADHAASLYIMNEAGLTRSLDWNRDADGRLYSTSSYKGMTNVIWRGGGLVYVVVSDLSEAETLKFAATF